MTLFYFLGIRYIDKKYEKNFQKVNLQLILKPLMNNIVIMDRGDIKAVQLRKEGILPVREKGGVACGVWVKGVRGGRNIEGGELTVCYDKKEEKKIGFLNGIYFSKEEEGIKNMLFISKQLLKNGIAPMFYEKQGLIEVPITDNKLSRFSYIHSDIEKAFLAVMIQSLKSDDQLFFTTHNTDILDLPLPKHSFTFKKKDSLDDIRPLNV